MLRISRYLGLALAVAGLLAPSVQAQEEAGEFLCRASVLRVNYPPNSEPVVANTGTDPCLDDKDHLALANVNVGNPVTARAELLNAQTDNAPTFGRAYASATNVSIRVGATTITAHVLGSQARAACNTETGKPIMSGTSNIVGLTINGRGIDVSGQPNQTINASPHVVVVINEQAPESDRITVRALRVTSATLATTAVISESVAGANCGQPPSRALIDFRSACEAAGGSFSFSPETASSPETWTCTKTGGGFSQSQAAGFEGNCLGAGGIFVRSSTYDPTTTVVIRDEVECRVPI